ncbi:MAG: COX15/CtaA family protein [Pirellulales bacterium]|nr:COX15/CtaA family protein [Pirellulales bacterium]
MSESRTLNPEPSRWPHRLAVVLCCATFPLVWVGGLVTTYQAGMAVPDWPNTYGYNLFLYPVETWLLGPWDIFIEHGHRLFASLVGLLTIALCVCIWRTRQPRWLKVLSLVALVGVVFQGVLGGLRVLLDERTIAKIHGCFGPAFFALTAAIAAVTSRRWQIGSRSIEAAQPVAVVTLAVATPLLAYLQLVLGAQLRHFDPNSVHAAFRTIVVFHVVVGVALAVHVVVVALTLWRKASRAKPLIIPSIALVALMASQLLLGAMTWFVNYGAPSFLSGWRWLNSMTIQANGWWQSQITTAHVAFGSLILAVSTVLAVRSARMLKLPSMHGWSSPKWKGVAA